VKCPIAIARKPRAEKISETELVRRILLALSERGVLCWRNNSGRLPDRFGRWVSFGLEGSPDVIGFCRHRGCAMFVAIEAKTIRGRLRDAQAAWGKQAQAAGVVYCVARSVEDVIRLIEQHRASHARPIPRRTQSQLEGRSCIPTL
jgi:hypothetical protein